MMRNATAAFRLLVATESAYCRLAAETQPLEAARLSWIKGYTCSPVGCVIHSVNEDEIPACSHFDWLAEVERSVSAAGSGFARILLEGHDTPLARTLGLAGYESRPRSAFTGAPTALAPDLCGACRRVRSGQDWFRYMRTHLEGCWRATGEDDPARWTALTRAKEASGKLEAYLIEWDGELRGSFCLMEADGLVRLRDLIVIPESRGRGYGAAAVSFAGEEGRRRGKNLLGAFAEDFSVAASLLQRLGLQGEPTLTEWARVL